MVWLVELQRQLADLDQVFKDSYKPSVKGKNKSKAVGRRKAKVLELWHSRTLRPRLLVTKMVPEG